jgi:hypothetical protein
MPIIIADQQTSTTQVVYLFLKPRHFNADTRELLWYAVIVGYERGLEIFDAEEKDRSRFLASEIVDMPETIRSLWTQAY